MIVVDTEAVEDMETSLEDIEEELVGEDIEKIEEEEQEDIEMIGEEEQEDIEEEDTAKFDVAVEDSTEEEEGNAL